VVALALAVLACDARTATHPAHGRPGLCSRLAVRVTGRVATAEAIELSGLALSRTRPRVLWAHNDSGDRARVFAVTPEGRLVAEVAVAGATNVDWEDIAIGPARDGKDALYIADIGDNRATRADVVVYRVPEPRIVARAPATTAPAQRLVLRYPDAPHDAEALLADPSTGALVIVTKDYDGAGGVYVARRPSAAATTTMRRAAHLSLGSGQAVTGGDVSADGRTIVLRTYDRAFVWSRRRGEPLASALRRRPCRAGARLLEGQGEALALTRDGRAFYTVPEGSRPALRRYEPTVAANGGAATRSSREHR
jgi:hypothetical protein